MHIYFAMPGGKGKSIGGKGGKGDAAGKAQKSHSAKAGLQVSGIIACLIAGLGIVLSESGNAIRAMSYSMKLPVEDASTRSLVAAR